MFTRTRMAVAATFLAGLAIAQEPTTLAPVHLGYPVYQPMTPGAAQPLPRSTNPLIVAQRPAPLYWQAGAQSPHLPDPRVVSPMPMGDPKLGPAPTNIPAMPPLPMVPDVPMQPVTPMIPMAPMNAVPMPPSAGVTTLPTTTLQPTYAPHGGPVADTMPMPTSPMPTIPGIPADYQVGGEMPLAQGDECGEAYAYRPMCFPYIRQALSQLCWTPPPAMCWVEGDYLNWWVRGTSLPPLVTRGAPTDPVPGALNQPGTTTLFGGSGALHSGVQQGLRATVGGRFGSTRGGWEVRGFLMNNMETNFNASSSPSDSVLARPFYDPVLNQPSSLFVGLPGSFAGQVSGELKTTFWGAEANLTRNMNDIFLDHLFVGFRYMQLVDVLNMRTNYSVLPGGVAFINGNGVTPGSFGTIQESVRAKNQFYGGQIGIRERWSMGRFTLDMRGSVAIGTGLQQIDVRGVSMVVDVDGRTVATGGVVGQPSNIGRFDRNDLTVIPEASARLTFALNSHVTLFGGYDFLYWANVVRVGDQIDPRVDSRQVPLSPLFNGAQGTNPVVGPRSTAFWAHGVSLGISLRY